MSGWWCRRIEKKVWRSSESSSFSRKAPSSAECSPARYAAGGAHMRTRSRGRGRRVACPDVCPRTSDSIACMRTSRGEQRQRRHVVRGSVPSPSPLEAGHQRLHRRVGHADDVLKFSAGFRLTSLGARGRCYPLRERDAVPAAANPIRRLQMSETRHPVSPFE